MKEINYRYQIYSPSGNDTALVFGIETDVENRSLINDYILGTWSKDQKDKNGFVVEQVGFINENKLSPKLVMAGGEFCGNAARVAAWYYLNGGQGEINISVSSVTGTLKAGVNDSCEAWVQMPISEIKEIDTGFYLVKIEGIVHLVVKQEQAKIYLDSIKQEMGMCDEKLKVCADGLLDEYGLKTNPAAGVIFLEYTNNGKLKIHPCVYVKEHGSFYYETACGSGTIAAGMVQCVIEKRNMELPIVQPSGKEIKAIVEYSNGEINKNQAIICGPIIIYKEVHELNISIPEILLIKDVEEWKKLPNKEEAYKIYKELFMDEPYNKEYNDDEAERFFSEYCKNGKLLLAYDGDIIVAFAAAVPLEKNNILDVIKSKGIEHDVSCDWCYANIGIAKKYQRRKIGFVLCKKLMKILPDTARKFMRTHIGNEASKNLHKKIGFKIIEGSEHYSPPCQKMPGKIERNLSILLELRKGARK